jgi:hypothetical protein
MWTDENRQNYNRDRLRYPSDLTDEEWSQVAKLIPAAKRGGRRRRVEVREVLNGIMYVLSTGCQWRWTERLRRVALDRTIGIVGGQVYPVDPAAMRRPVGTSTKGDHYVAIA